MADKSAQFEMDFPSNEGGSKNEAPLHVVRALTPSEVEEALKQYPTIANPALLYFKDNVLHYKDQPAKAWYEEDQRLYNSGNEHWYDK